MIGLRLASFLAALLATLLAALLETGVARADPATDPAQLGPTWEQALVAVPGPDGQTRRIPTAELPAYLAANPARPIVVYAHGCSGLGRMGRTASRLYSAHGYVFVAPDSFARPVKPVSCAPARLQGGLPRAVLGWRHAEIDHALTRLRGLSRAPVVLAGHSEGGIAVATYRGQPVTARVIEGWGCHAGWPEYRGLNAPTREPVLSLVGAGDPWFQHPALQGDCGAFMDGNDQSIVFRAPDRRHRRHWLTRDPTVFRLITGFLATYL